MFRQKIYETPFVGNPDADKVFERIQGSELAGDVSVLSTLRALLGTRLEEDEHFDFSFKTSLDLVIRENELSFILTDGLEEKKLLVDTMISGGAYGNAKRSDRVEAWLSSNGVDVIAVVDEEKKSAFIVFSNENQVKFISAVHLCEALIPAILPKFFEEKKCDDEEKAMLISLGKRSAAEYLKALEVLVKRYNLEEAKIRRLLDGYEAIFDRRKLESVKSSIDSLRSRIVDARNLISDYLIELRDQQAREIGLQERIDRGESENAVMDFFLENKDVSIVYANTNGDIKFTAKGYCSTFDSDAAEATIRNNRSNLYTHCQDEETKNAIKKLMTSVFVDEDIKLRFCAAYMFYNQGTRVDGISGYQFSAGFETYLPNPHIQRYACIGNYVVYIEEYLTASNYIGAITQCMESMTSINWNDGPVIRELGLQVVSNFNDLRCYELPDGRCVTGKEAVEYLEEKEKEEK